MMNLVEAWASAKEGECLRSPSLQTAIHKVADIGLAGYMLDADDWEIVGRWPVPTEPGWYWHKSEHEHEEPFVVRVRRGSQGYLLANGTLLINWPTNGKWGPRTGPPAEWLEKSDDGE